MKILNKISLILISVMVITIQLNASDTPEQTKTEQSQPSTIIIEAQKALHDATKEAAGNIVNEIIKKGNLLKQISLKQIAEDDSVSEMKKLDATILQIKQDFIKKTTSQMSYTQMFAANMKKIGSYMLYPFGSVYTNQQTALADAIVEKLKEELKNNKEIEQFLSDEIYQQKNKPLYNTSTVTQKVLLGLLFLKAGYMQDPYGNTIVNYPPGHIGSWSTLKQSAAAAALLAAIYGAEKLLKKKNQSKETP